MNKEQELITSLQNRIKELETEREEFTRGGIKILFSGKANAQQVARNVKPRTLKEIPELSIGSEEQKSKNLVIEGDNLMSMVTLYQYHGKIDLIITDPPYNTGRDFRFNDKWNEDINDENLGEYVRADDTSRHTKWMKFMLPRIQMMWKMLKSNGVLAICIDYRELVRLMQLLDEILGESNRISIINWQKTTVNSLVKHISVCIEYILVYAKNKENSETNLLPKSDENFDNYGNPDNDPLGDWNRSPATAKGLIQRNKNVYAIQNPFTGELIYPGKDATSQGRDWSNTKENIKKWLEEYGSEYEERDLKDGVSPALVIKDFKNFTNTQQDSLIKISREKAQRRLAKENWPKLVFSKQGLGRPGIKRYLKDVREGKVATDYWNEEDSISTPLKSELGGSSITANYELRERINEQFIGVKPLKLFTKIFQLWGSSLKRGICLDPFAGTGTTGEIILQFNKELQAERERAKSTDSTKPLSNNKHEWQFILIEQGFNTNEEDKKEKNYCRTLLQKRLKAVITGQWADGKPHEPLGGGFKFLTLDKTIDEQSLLKMKRKEIIEAIFASQITSFSTTFENSKYKYLIAKNKQNEGIFLVWNGKNKSQITQDIYHQIVEESQWANLSIDKHHVYARLRGFATSSIQFEQIPEKILQDLGSE